MTVMANEQDSTLIRNLTEAANHRQSASGAADSTGGVAQRPQIPATSGVRPVTSSPVAFDPLLNIDPLGAGSPPAAADSDAQGATAPARGPSAPAASEPRPAQAEPMERSSLIDALAGFGGGLRGDDNKANLPGHSVASPLGSAARVAGKLGISSALTGVDTGNLARDTGTIASTLALMANEARGAKPEDVGQLERSQLLVSEDNRARKREAFANYLANSKADAAQPNAPAPTGPRPNFGLGQSAGNKLIRALRLGRKVEDDGQRPAYEMTMDETEKLNEPRPETSGFTKAMQTLALPGQGLVRVGNNVMGIHNPEHAMHRGEYADALADSSLGLANQGVRAGLTTAGHVALPVVGGVAASTAYTYGVGGATRIGGEILSRPFRMLGGDAQDQADAYDKQWNGGTEEQIKDGTAETRAQEVLRRGFKPRGQATGPDAVGWSDSGAHDSRNEVHRNAKVEPKADAEEPGLWDRFTNWAGSTWLGQKAKSAYGWLGRKAYDFAGAPLQQAWKKTKSVASSASDAFTNWWSSRQDRSGHDRTEALQPENMANGSAPDEAAEHQEGDPNGLEELDPENMVR